MEKERKVITVQIDEEFYDSLMANGGNGGKSNMKYYSCLGDYSNDEQHDVFLVDNANFIVNTGDTYETIIGPEYVYNLGSYEAFPIAVAINMDKRCYDEGEWISLTEYLQRYNGFDPATHAEITEEEFYHIPEDVIIPYRDREKLGEIFEDCYSKLLRYGVQPSGNSIFDSTPIKFPIPFLGHKTISVELHPNDFTRTNENYIVYFFTCSDYYRPNDQWYDWDIPNQNEFVENVEVVCLELCYSGIAMCRILYPDGTKEYLCPIVAG